MQAAGFKFNKGKKGVRCMGIDGWWEKKPVIVGAKAGPRFKKSAYFSQLVMQWLDAIIVMPVLKTDDMTGVSLCLLSALDYTQNRNTFRARFADPYGAMVNNIPKIKKITKLGIIDGMRGIFKGKKFTAAVLFEPGEIIVSKDIVAADSIGVQVIDEERERRGLESLRTKMGERLKYHIHHLIRAETNDFNIGRYSLSRIKVDKKEVKKPE